MPLLVLFLIAFTPGLFWLWLFLRRNLYRPAPRRLVALTFFLGMLSTIPAGILNFVFFDDSVLYRPTSFGAFASGMLLVVGPVEETCKFLAVRLWAFRSLYFDEPADGLVYAAAASLGFASLENLFYVLQFGPEVMVGRAFLSTLAHLVFGSFWGYALGKQVEPGTRSRALWLAGGLGTAAVLHGFFNISVFVFWPATLAILAVGIWWVLGRFRWGRRVSPFRYRRNYPRITCSGCGQRIVVISRYCRFCGERTSADGKALHCSNCSTANPPDASFCSGCGDRLIRR